MEDYDLFIKVTFIIDNKRREYGTETLVLIMHFLLQCLQICVGI